VFEIIRLLKFIAIFTADMKAFIKKILNIGIVLGLSNSEEKRIKLLNFICITWYAIMLVFVVTDYFFEENYSLVLVGYFFQFMLLVLVQVLQHKRKYISARILFISLSFIQFFAFSNFIIPGSLIELFYILIPLFSLLFLEDKRFHYFYLILVIISFSLPNYFYHIYEESLFDDPTTIPILFIAIFLLVNYFKNLNIKSEKRLKDLKNIALRDKELVENQKKELERVYDFQNQFFVNIAHEIRTPLTIIKGNINKINEGGSTTGNQQLVEVLKTQTNKIQHIVTNIIDLTKIDSNDFLLNLEKISFSSFIAKIFNSFQSNFQNKGITYQIFDTTDKNIVISADKSYLENAIDNIITNALKYTERDNNVTIIIEQKNNTVTLKIKDSGIGIEKSEQDKIFNRFYQSDNSINRSGGSGVGLAYSREIIKKHAGEITVESEKKSGSTFIITLPIATFTAQKRDHIDIDSSKLPVDSKQNLVFSDKVILLVEDNIDMRSYISDILSSYTIVEAENGLEGLEKLNTHKIDFIITDYMMPKMNGYDFVKTVKENNNTVPILMLTAKTENDTKLEMLRLGIDDYITKPFEEEELLLRIINGFHNYSNRQKYLETEKISLEELRESKYLSELKEFIEHNCMKEVFGVADICDRFAMSQSTLYRRIKSLTGLNTKEFITEIRLQKARELFTENPLLTIKEISYKIGFVNSTYFGKLYEDRFGSTF